jgi:hypothetical protein
MAVVTSSRAAPTRSPRLVPLVNASRVPSSRCARTAGLGALPA